MSKTARSDFWGIELFFDHRSNRSQGWESVPTFLQLNTMKTILTMTFSLAFSVAGFAAEPNKVAKEDCKKCDVAKAECAKECAAADTAYVVKGMTCGGCSNKVKAALAKMEGVKVNGVCYKSGHVAVNFDSAKTCPKQVLAAIDSTGFKVTGQQVSYKVTGMTCAGCSGAVQKVLAGTEGVTEVKSVCHKSGHAVVVIDPAKTCATNVAAAIDKTKFKVAKEG